MTTQELAKEIFVFTPTSTPNFYDVLSSNGWDHYPMSVLVSGKITCGCKGFKYEKHCKHADQAVEELTFIAPAVEVEVELIQAVEIPGTDGLEVTCSNCGAWVMSQAFDRHLRGRYCEVYGGVLPAAAPVLVAVTAPAAIEDEDPTRCGCGKSGFSMVGGQWYCGPCLEEMAAAVAEAEKIVTPVSVDLYADLHCDIPDYSKGSVEAVCIECGLYPALPNSEVCQRCTEYLYDQYVETMQPTLEQAAQEEAYWKSLGLEGQFAAHQEKELEEHLLAEYDALPQEEKNRLDEEEGRGADWQAERAAYSSDKDNHDIFGIF